MEFCKDNVTILNCFTLIAWMDSNGIQNMNSAWKKLLMDSAAERDFEGFESDDSAFIDEVMSMGKSLGLE